MNSTVAEDPGRPAAGSLRGRVFAATFAASVAAVAIALAIGIVTTRQAIRESFKREVAREASVMASRVATFVQNNQNESDFINRGELPESVRRLLDPATAGATLRSLQNETAAQGKGTPGHGTPGAGTPGAGAPGAGAPGAGAQAVPPSSAVGPPARDRRRRDALPPLILPTRVANAVLSAHAAQRLSAGKGVSGSVDLTGTRMLYAAEPVAGHDLFVLATRSNDVAAGDYGKYVTGLVLAALIAAALSAAAAAGLSRRLTRPIADVVAAASTLASGATPELLAEPRTAELAELARAFNEMADRLARAREAERTVLMSASHELRTPLTAISGYAEGIEDGTIDVKTGAAVIRSESLRLENLVQDLLVLARLDQGTFEAHSERVDLESVAADVRDRLALRAEAAGVALEVTVAAGSVATADTGRVMQVVTNLTDNAVRVTPRGGRVLIETAPAEIRVHDTGPGIPEVDLPHVFERFHMRRRHGMGSPDGSGIGLAIVRELTQAMGGEVSVRSVEGRGTTFTVRLRSAVSG
ncbi:MAG: HAMP domain-containing histidine kinase [Actinobacteria bacterium]|nr:HAMP domain-containing histidine kinase [Actinomycetota bacterium]